MRAQDNPPNISTWSKRSGLFEVTLWSIDRVLKVSRWTNLNARLFRHQQLHQVAEQVLGRASENTRWLSEAVNSTRSFGTCHLYRYYNSYISVTIAGGKDETRQAILLVYFSQDMGPCIQNIWSRTDVELAGTAQEHAWRQSNVCPHCSETDVGWLQW